MVSHVTSDSRKQMKDHIKFRTEGHAKKHLKWPTWVNNMQPLEDKKQAHSSFVEENMRARESHKAR